MMFVSIEETHIPLTDDIADINHTPYMKSATRITRTSKQLITKALHTTHMSAFFALSFNGSLILDVKEPI